jgi:hypothetical protein
MVRKVSAKSIESWRLIKDAGVRIHYGGITYEETERLYIEAGGVIPQSNTRNDSVTESSEGEGKDHCETDSEPKIYGEGCFAQSPIRPLMQAYAINDVRVLPVMLRHYTAHRFWNDKWEQTDSWREWARDTTLLSRCQTSRRHRLVGGKWFRWTGLRREGSCTS